VILSGKVGQACPILTTCSSRASGDSTRTSGTSRKTMVTSGSICTSHDMVFFSDKKWSVTCCCISLRQGPTQLARVVQLVQVVKLHLIKKGRGPVNSYESFNSFKWWNCISLRKAGARSTRTSCNCASFFEHMTPKHSLHETNRTPNPCAYAGTRNRRR